MKIIYREAHNSFLPINSIDFSVDIKHKLLFNILSWKVWQSKVNSWFHFLLDHIVTRISPNWHKIFLSYLWKSWHPHIRLGWCLLRDKISNCISLPDFSSSGKNFARKSWIRPQKTVLCALDKRRSRSG